jgi:hypothetical protein
VLDVSLERIRRQAELCADCLDRARGDRPTAAQPLRQRRVIDAEVQRERTE